MFVLYDFTVAAPDSTMAPTISLASSDADVSAAILVVFPPDVAERDILATSDPYVSVVRYFSHRS